ncbi:hypothetical protein [Nocardia farcinica]|uniref:hypothetical protein n=1 Tax=Nocardia farcinica TaxID=37329 RepID=UPI001145F82E|nr:hypothetical protein [Nocardia farcinica]
MPAVTGTDRQVPWATTIRADALALLDEMLAYIDSEEPTAAAGQRAVDEHRVIECYRRIYLAAAQAKAWIDYRAWALRPGGAGAPPGRRGRAQARARRTRRPGVHAAAAGDDGGVTAKRPPRRSGLIPHSHGATIIVGPASAGMRLRLNTSSRQRG